MKIRTNIRAGLRAVDDGSGGGTRCGGTTRCGGVGRCGGSTTYNY